MDLASSNRSGGLAHVPTDFTASACVMRFICWDQDLVGQWSSATVRGKKPFGSSRGFVWRRLTERTARSIDTDQKC